MSSLCVWVSLFLSFLLQLIPCLNTSVPCLPTGLFWLLVLPVGKYLLQVRNGGLELLVCPCCPNTNSYMTCRFLKTFWNYWHSSVFVTASTRLKWSCMHGCILCLWWLAADNNAYWNVNIPFGGMLVCWLAYVFLLGLRTFNQRYLSITSYGLSYFFINLPVREFLKLVKRKLIKKEDGLHLCL